MGTIIYPEGYREWWDRGVGYWGIGGSRRNGLSREAVLQRTDDGLRLSTGETMVEARARLRANGIKFSDVRAEADVVYYQMDPRDRDKANCIRIVLEKWGPDRFPWPDGRGAGMSAEEAAAVEKARRMRDSWRS